jgi:hypothetical protein
MVLSAGFIRNISGADGKTHSQQSCGMRREDAKVRKMREKHITHFKALPGMSLRQLC